MLSETIVSIGYIRSEDNVADVLTKSSDALSFKRALPALMGSHSVVATN